MIHRVALAILALAVPVTAGAFSLELPLVCTLDQDCYIQQTVDHDPSPAASDFTCGTLTYDGHKGTDFALPSLAAQAAGVNVVAAASGIVQGVRNDMTDILQGSPGAPDVTGRECGNGLVIRHDDGWETQYCHMKQGSVVVASGQTVVAGQVLGQVGLSGQTQFPHLHLSVRHNGAVVDPFDPDGQITCDAPSADTLWSAPLSLAPGGIIAAGFSDAVPGYDAIKAGTAETRQMPVDAPGLVIWGYLYGSQPGDQIMLSIRNAAGEVFVGTQILDRTQAQLFRAGGRRTPAGGWPTGTYTGTVQLIRNGVVLDSQTATATLR